MDLTIIFVAKYVIFLSAGVAVVYFFKQPRPRQKEMFIFALILFPLSYIAAKLVSRFYFDPRPFVLGNFTPLLPHAPDNGFPSDHTLAGAAIAFAVFRFDKKWGAGLLVLALIVGFSRVLAGVHHTVDILGSVIVVLAVYFFVEYFFPKILKKYFSSL